MQTSLDLEMNKEISFNNVLVLRKTMQPAEISKEITDFMQMLRIGGIQKNGPLIMGTHNLGQISDTNRIDMEIIIPVDRIPNSIPANYVFRQFFSIQDAIYYRYSGNPEGINEVYQVIFQELQQRHLKPSISYNVHVNDQAFLGNGNPVIDIYLTTSE